MNTLGQEVPKPKRVNLNQINICVTQDRKKQLQKLADNAGSSLSGITRYFLIKGLETEGLNKC